MPSNSWVGGDIAGLHAMAQALKSAPEEMRDIPKALGSKVQAITADAGWEGDAAKKFSEQWSKDSVTAGALADATQSIGDAIEELASILEDLEKTLYNAAHEARSQGVPVRDDGKPPEVATTPNPPPEQHKMLKSLQGYAEDHRLTMEAAQSARLVAEEKLRTIYDSIGPDQGEDSTITASQGLTVGGYVKSLYAIPGSRTREIIGSGPTELAAAKQQMKESRPAYQSAKQAYEAKGMNIPKGHPARLEHSKAATKLQSIRGRISAAEAGATTNRVSNALDTRVTDLPKLGGMTGRLPKFLKGVSALGVLGTGAGAVLDTKTDMDKGDSGAHAGTVNAVSGGAGLAAGVAITGAVGGPAVVGVTAGAAGAIVVGDAVKEGFNEHWEEDIHKHGVAGGIATGVGHVATNTGKDVSQLFTGVWNTFT